MPRFALVSVSACLLLIACSLVGCGSNDSGDDAGNASGSGAAPSTTTSANHGELTHRLVGVWLGVGYLDDELLASKLAAIADEQQRAEVEAMAKSFQSTRLGLEFHADHRYDVDMQIVSTSGQVMRGQTTGTWTIVKEDGDRVRVESQEQNAEGELEPQEAEYTFLDQDHFAFQAPVNPVLLDCSPVIVFERQALEKAATTAAETEPTTQR